MQSHRKRSENAKQIERTLDKVCPKRECKSKKEHPWWDDECELRKNEFCRAEKRVKDRSIPKEDDWENLKTEQSCIKG